MAVQMLTKKAVRARQAAGDERVTALTAAEIELQTKDHFIQEISNLWVDVQKRVLLIGRYLNRAKQILPHGEFQQMLRYELPFSEQVAYQMRQVAAAVDAGRFEERELPRNYSVAYQLVTLSEHELVVARERELFRPNVRRSEVLALKRELRFAGRDDRQALLAERERLLERLVEIEAALEPNVLAGHADIVVDRA